MRLGGRKSFPRRVSLADCYQARVNLAPHTRSDQGIGRRRNHAVKTDLALSRKTRNEPGEQIALLLPDRNVPAPGHGGSVLDKRLFAFLFDRGQKHNNQQQCGHRQQAGRQATRDKHTPVPL